MSRKISEPSEGLRAGPVGLRDAVDLWGPDLAKWPDIAQLRHAREALLSDRSFRVYRDGAVATDRQLKAAATALDERIAAKGSVARISEAVLARVEPRQHRPYARYAGLAAVLVIAGMLGGAAQWVRIDHEAGAQFEVVQLDPLLFGPAEMGF